MIGDSGRLEIMDAVPPLFVTSDSSVRGWIFDLDGTLLDTLDDLANAINVMLAGRGLTPRSRDEVCAGVGDGMERLVERMLPRGMDDPAGVAVALADYRTAYRENWWRKTRPYPRVLEDLRRLMREGCVLGVVSNKPQEFTARMVEHFFPAPDYAFDVIFGEREGVARKPDPAALLEAAEVIGLGPGDCAYVGDSPGDMVAARAAGMVAIGVDWGFRDAESLRQAGARTVLSNRIPVGQTRAADSSDD